MSYLIRNNSGIRTERNVKSITSSDSPYTALTRDEIILVDASGGAVTVTLPTAVVGVAGKIYKIVRTDILNSSNLVTIATTSSQTIHSAPAHYLWPAEFVEVVSDNANWQIIDRTGVSLFHQYMMKGTTNNKRYSSMNQGIYAGFQPSTTSPAVNTLWALPYHVPVTTKYDIITFTLTTAAASSHARAGIYRDNGAFYPGALIFDTGSIDTSTGTVKDTTITAGLQVFPPGLYWLAWECDLTGLQIHCHQTTGTFFALIGHSSGNVATSYGYSVAHTFGALPDPYTTSATVLGGAPTVSNPVPALFLRAL